jgi:hypothetical protein
MFVHEMYPGGRKLHIIRGDWADVLEEKSTTGLVQIRSNPDSNFNKNCCLTSLEAIVPYNVAFLPQDLQDPGCQEFAVIDRYRKMGDY